MGSAPWVLGRDRNGGKLLEDELTFFAQDEAGTSGTSASTRRSTRTGSSLEPRTPGSPVSSATAGIHMLDRPRVGATYSRDGRLRSTSSTAQPCSRGARGSASFVILPVGVQSAFHQRCGDESFLEKTSTRLLAARASARAGGSAGRRGRPWRRPAASWRGRGHAAHAGRRRVLSSPESEPYAAWSRCRGLLRRRR